MIDPANITNFSRTVDELQEFLLFCICVAGKNAVVQAQKLDDFLSRCRTCSWSPFECVQELHEAGLLRSELERVRLGKYGLLEPGFLAAAKLGSQIEYATRDDLAGIPGVGLKTASFFLLHSRADQRIAVLDTYVLKFLGRQHPKMALPDSSPQQASKYGELESVFLGECLKAGQLDVAKADLNCWNSRGFSLS